MSSERRDIKKGCIVGASGKLGTYRVQHAFARGYEVGGVCRAQSVGKLDAFKGLITIVPGMTTDRAVIKRAVAGCGGGLTELVPWGVQQYSTGTAQAGLDHAPPGARLIFSSGWYTTRDGRDVYSWTLKAFGGCTVSARGSFVSSTSTIRWKPWRATNSSMRPWRLSAARRPSRSRTLPRRGCRGCFHVDRSPCAATSDLLRTRVLQTLDGQSRVVPAPPSM